jgi:hypothetical protein
MKYHVSRILIIVLVFTVAGCAITERYDKYVGKVVDGETKQPIEGAAVLVVYYTQHWGLAGSVTYYADAQETVTDAKGEFRIPPIRLYTFQMLAGWEQHPGVTIFKPGYGCYPSHKYAVSSHHDPNRMVSVGEVPGWSLPPEKHVTIELPRLMTREEILDMPSLNFDIPYEKQKRLVELINQEMERLGATEKYNKESFGW